MAASEIIPLLRSGLESLEKRLDSIADVLTNRIDAQDAKIEAVNSKQNTLIVVIAIIGSALTIVLSLN